MATKTKTKRTKTTAKKTAPKKRPATKKKTLKTARKATAGKKVQQKKQTQKKPQKRKTEKVTKPAGKPVKSIGTRGTKATPKRLAQKKRKPAAKVRSTRVARKTRQTTSTEDLLSHRKELLRKQLIEKREEIVREAKNEIAKYIKGEANQLAETALDDGDWSVIDLSADINLRRLETHRERLLRIDEALMKLREGTYGVCEECGGEITAERLRVMPFAIYCRDCQEKKEELEKIEREEIVT